MKKSISIGNHQNSTNIRYNCSLYIICISHGSTTLLLLFRIIITSNTDGCNFPISYILSHLVSLERKLSACINYCVSDYRSSDLLQFTFVVVAVVVVVAYSSISSVVLFFFVLFCCAVFLSSIRFHTDLVPFISSKKKIFFSSVIFS